MQQIIKSSNLTADVEQAIQQILHDKLFILTDENTRSLCLPLIKTISPMKEAHNIVIPPGDTNKTVHNLSTVWERLTKEGATRHSLMINLGGGMVTDLGGFAAATFKRGIKYINIPTTLLGAVDAAVGGKTGVNFLGYKNEIGSFYPAQSVIISSDFFRSLEQPDLRSGYAEMIKHALIHSNDEWGQVLSFNLEGDDYSVLDELVFRSVKIKEAIVEKDPFEKNIRKALNFGHTTGHAFESFAMRNGKPVPHGYAVAWGMIVELWLSFRTCEFPKDKLQRSVRYIRDNYGAYPITCDNYDTLYEITLHDKKNMGDTVNFTLLADIGEIRIDQTADKELLFEAFDFYRDSVGL